MKRFLIALAVSSLAVLGSANAASVPNLFKFADVDGDSASFTAATSLLEFYATSPFELRLLDSASTAYDTSGLVNGLGISSGSPLEGVQTIIGTVVIQASDGALSYSDTTGGATGSVLGTTNKLSGGVSGTFSVGLASSSLSTITPQNDLGGNPLNKYEFVFQNGISVTLDDIIAVPIPAAALLFLSGIGGLLLVARRNSARNRKENRVDEPLLA